MIDQGKLSYKEWKKQKQLDDARKAGTAPAEVDSFGHEINPHIPQYISKVPWYYGSQEPGLGHQRMDPASAPVPATEHTPQTTEKLDREDAGARHGLVRGAAPTRYRRGACTNCGAMTHTAKECCERPRAVGAAYSGRDLMPDEVMPSQQPKKGSALSYDAKHDRWSGYDPQRYEAAAARKFGLIERERLAVTRAREEESLGAGKQNNNNNNNNNSNTNSGGSSSNGGDDDELVEGDGYNNAPIQRQDDKTHMTVRDLRIREDTAKYLRNLDLNSAYYDPKTRSMRENPTPNADPRTLTYAGDNFVRATGDAKRFYEEQLFAQEAEARGQAVNMAAVPMQAELLAREYRTRKEALKREQRRELFERYGGEEHLLPAADADNLRYAQSESFKLYTRAGTEVRDSNSAAAAAAPRKSRWEEDVFINNHTSVWGSWWEDGHWGYKCCHSLIKNSYCTGELGYKHTTEGGYEKKEDFETTKTKEDDLKEKKEHTEETSAEKLKRAIEEERRRQHMKVVGDDLVDEDEEGKEGGSKPRKKKPKYGAGGNGNNEVTAEEMEAYLLTKYRSEDPMNNFK